MYRSMPPNHQSPQMIGAENIAPPPSLLAIAEQITKQLVELHSIINQLEMVASKMIGYEVINKPIEASLAKTHTASNLLSALNVINEQSRTSTEQLGYIVGRLDASL